MSVVIDVEIYGCIIDQHSSYDKIVIIIIIIIISVMIIEVGYTHFLSLSLVLGAVRTC